MTRAYSIFLLLSLNYGAVAFTSPALRRRSVSILLHASRRDTGAPPAASSTTDTATTKQRLLDLLQQTPRNAPTPASLTTQILSVVEQLEASSPADPSSLDSLAGTWTLLWTAQDKGRAEAKSIFALLNPLENQSYSNNPGGRANPVLPRNIQDRLEEFGFIQANAGDNDDVNGDSERIKSTQTIDIGKKQVINVVGIVLGNTTTRRRATVTVIVDFTRDRTNPRRLLVKFQSCRVAISKSPIKFNIPLGIIGPKGWLQTDYIDDTMRITRGHKGSVFVLTR